MVDVGVDTVVDVGAETVAVVADGGVLISAIVVPVVDVETVAVVAGVDIVI